MKKLSQSETKILIELVLAVSSTDARSALHAALQLKKQHEGQFYKGVVEHGLSLRLTTDQWFEILSRFPNRILRSDLDLEGLLSEEQLKRLPPVTG